jgi:hypothetical protein
MLRVSSLDSIVVVSWCVPSFLVVAINYSSRGVFIERENCTVFFREREKSIRRIRQVRFIDIYYIDIDIDIYK